jgi:hypothetical protein
VVAGVVGLLVVGLVLLAVALIARDRTGAPPPRVAKKADKRAAKPAQVS